MEKEKVNIALYTLLATAFIAIVKIIIGIITGSLGVISEAAHSSLDLGGAAIAYFAVRLSDKPADREHHYGHGKIENFSALLLTILLLITCGWIVYEAVEKMFFGKSTEVIGMSWGILVMILSIIVNYICGKVSRATAEKYGSQALEANALHFDSDVWSSLVVIGGLVCVWFGEYFKMPVLYYGDPIAALGVSALIAYVSIGLGKRTIDVLLDTAPEGMINNIMHEVNAVDGVLAVETVRVRPSGPSYFIDLSVGINRNESHRVVHSIVDAVKTRLHDSIPNSNVLISTYPVDLTESKDREVYHTVKKIVDRFPVCTNIHNVHVYEVGHEKFIAIHLEVKEKIDLNESHKLSHEISEEVQSAIADVKDVSVNFEYVNQHYIEAEDVTEQNRELIREIDSLVNKSPENLSCHDIKLYKQSGKYVIFLHCEIKGNQTADNIEAISDNITSTIKDSIENVENIHIHVEPMNA